MAGKSATKRPRRAGNGARVAVQTKPARRERAAARKGKAQAPRRNREVQEAAILEAAERVFAGAGFGGATMAAIAKAAGLPKPNLHYYFGSKHALYRAMLERLLTEWLEPADYIVASADPRDALERYIREKMRLSFARPYASRVWANELLHGAVELRETLVRKLRPLVRRKVAVLEEWIAAGRMAPVDSWHLFFTIWAATQTYADFDAQVCAVLGSTSLDAAARERATVHVVSLILRGCGLS